MVEGDSNSADARLGRGEGIQIPIELTSSRISLKGIHTHRLVSEKRRPGS
jgi:hypothetical protein